MTDNAYPTMPLDADTYDARQDAHDSYFLAVEMKRRRGDRHWPEALCLAAFGSVPVMNSKKMNATIGDLGHDD